MMRSFVRVVVALLCLFTLAEVAEAQVAISLSGRRRGAVGQQLERRLAAEGIEVVTRTGAGRPSVIAQNSGAVAVIKGNISRRAGRWRVVLRVHDANGREQDRVSVAARTVGGLATRAANRLAGPLRELGAGAGGGDGGSDEPEDEPPPSGGTRRVVVGSFTGRGAARARSQVVRALSGREYELVPQDDLQAAARRLEVDLETEDGLRDAARELEVAAYLSGTGRRRGRMWTVSVLVRNGADGREVGSADFGGRSAARMAATVSRAGYDRLSPLIAQTEAPAAVQAVVGPIEVDTGGGDDDEDEDEDEDEPDEPSTPLEREYDALDLMIAAHPFSRRLSYNQDLYGLLREYSLQFGPAVLLTGRWYLGAHFTNGFGAHLGIDFSWERAFGIDSKRADGEVFPTNSRAWYVGARGRLPYGRHEFSVGAGYGLHSFVVESAGPSQPGRLNVPLLPGATYRYIGFGAEARFVTEVGFVGTIRIGYRVLTDLGGIESNLWFPRASGGGMDAGVEVGWAFDEGLELRLGWDVRRYFMSFNPQVTDPNIAGGAVDQYFGYTLGLAYRY